MASGVKKLQINVDVQAAFTSALKEAENFKKKLSSLSLPKTITKDLEKDLADYQKNLQKLLNFKPTTNNLGEYRNLIGQLNESFKQLNVSMNSLESNTQEAFANKPKINNYKQQIESLKNEIQALDKATKSYYKVTSSDSKKKQEAAIKEKEEQTSGLTGAAAESTAKKQEQMKAALKESAKLKERLAKLEAQLAETIEKTNKAQEEAKNKAKAAGEAFGNMTPPVKEASKSLEELSEDAAKIKADDLSNTMMNNIKRITALGVAVNYAHNQLQKMKETYLELDKSLTQIAVVSGRTRDEMWANVDAYNEMARRLGTTTTEVVEASKLYYQQGKTQSEVMELVEQTAILASISELEFADATEYLTAAINGFKLEADDAANITDVWANLAAKAAVDTDELAVAISKVASIAKSAGADIETTSAFLTKMIETTREAPENLGTALKTIIARFQELKDSTEALEDGVDANKVEKALKEADVALRDSTGQFRDFDDVIMELSSKWDGLDRNTQRYIATIAAGARQQSRFIALVEDYDRNVELVNMAQNSAGASAAQFNTQLTGLEASMNRLRSSWEALYLSLNEGPTLLSSFIDAIADLVQSFADLGFGATAIFAAIGVALTQLTVTWLSTSKAVIAAEAAKKGAMVTTKVVADAVNNSFKASMKALGPYAAILVIIGVIIGGIILAVQALNKAFNKHKIAAREAAEAAREYNAAAAEAKQQYQSIEDLSKKYEEAYNKGEDLAEIQNQLLDQYPDLAKEIDFATDSYSEINKKLEEYIKLKKIEAAENFVKGKKEEVKEKEESVADIQSKGLSNYDYTLTGISAYRNKDTGEIVYDSNNTLVFNTNYELVNKFIDDEGNEFIGTAKEFLKYLQEKDSELQTLLKEAESAKEISFSMTKDISIGLATEINSEGNEDLISLMLYGITTDDFDEETGKLKEDIKNNLQENLPKLQQISKQILANNDNPELQEAWSKLLTGDTSLLTQDIINQLENLGLVFDEVFPGIAQLYQEKTEQLDNQLKAYGASLGEDFSNSFKQMWIDRLDSANNDELENSLSNILYMIEHGLNSDVFGENTEKIQEALNKIDPYNVNDLVDILALLEDSGIDTSNALTQTLLKTLRQVGSVGEEAAKELDSFYNELKKITSAVDEGMSFEDTLNMIMESEGALSTEDFSLDPLTGKWKLSQEAAERYAEALKQIQLEKIADKKASLEAAIAQAEQENATLHAALAAAKSGSAYSQEAQQMSVLAKIVEILNNLLGINVSASAQAVDSILAEGDSRAKLVEELEAQVSSSDKNLEALRNEYEMLKSSETAIENETAAKMLNTKASQEAAKASGKAADAAQAYADALKEQAEALQAATEAEQKRIETEVEGIKKVLEARKKALEEQNEAIQEQIDKEKEAQEILLEAYLKYLEKRKDEYQKTLDDMEKAAEKAREAADESNENLTFQNQIAQDYYKDQIELIDEKINALNKEAQAEDRLQKLQEARDAYERAKNTKNRLVLVRGAGWVFKRDQEELSSTYDALRDAEREVEIAKLNEEKELLQDQANAWAEKAENIGKTTEELEKYNKAYKEFSDMTEEQRKEALNAFIEAVIRNNQLNQDATDKENAFEDQSDAEKEGTLAWNIAKVEELSEQTSELIDKIGKSAEDLIKDNKINQVVDSLDNLLGDKGIEGLVSHLDTLTHGVNTYIDNFLKLSEQMTQNENAIDAIDKALEDWDELTENLGKSQSELNKELELFNYYNKMTIEQLSKDSAVYNDIANQVSNLADQWERVNAAQAAYEAAQAHADAISKASSGEGYATGGVNTYTGLAAVHGTKSRPEVFLNNSQAGALFKFIDGLTRMPTLNKRNTPQNVVASTSKTEDNSTNYTNCKFEVVSNEDSIDSLLQDVKNRSPLRKF